MPTRKKRRGAAASLGLTVLRRLKASRRAAVPRRLTVSRCVAVPRRLTALRTAAGSCRASIPRLVVTALAACVMAPVIGTASARASDPSPTPEPLPTPPATTVTGADTAWHARPVALTFAAVDHSGLGIAATEYSVDGGPWQTGTAVTVDAPPDHSNDGAHVVSFWSRDNAGAMEAARTCTVRIDTRAPQAAWRSVRPRIYFGSGVIRLTATVRDLSGARASLRVYNAYGRRVYSGKPGPLRTGTQRSSWSGRGSSGRRLPPGNYTLRLVLSDAAGNRSLSPAAGLCDQRAVSSMVVRTGDARGRRVALTFDDGGDAGAWASILRTLKRAGIHAAFFPTGQMVVANPGLARRTVAQGHDVGNHSWSHPAMSTIAYGTDLSQLRMTGSAWWRIARVTPAPFFRPPYGDMSATVTAAAGAAGYRYTVLWSVDPQDWSSPGVGAIISRVLGPARPGSIILMHTCDETAAALPPIIAGLRHRGLHAVPLHELLGVR